VNSFSGSGAMVFIYYDDVGLELWTGPGYRRIDGYDMEELLVLVLVVVEWDRRSEGGCWFCWFWFGIERR